MSEAGNLMLGDFCRFSRWNIIFNSSKSGGKCVLVIVFGIYEVKYGFLDLGLVIVFFCRWVELKFWVMLTYDHL